MKLTIQILVWVAVVAFMVFMLVVVALDDDCRPGGAKPLDPRAPPFEVEPQTYIYKREHSETWEKIPVEDGTVAVGTEAIGGTDAARFGSEQQRQLLPRSGGKEASTRFGIGSRLKEELFDYGPKQEPSGIPPCDGSCRAPVPAASRLPRSSPPAPSLIGERAPYWYEREGIYHEPDYPEPEPERQGLFSRLRARRGR